AAAVRPGAIGTAGRFDLEETQVHPHLAHLAAVPRLHETGLHDSWPEIPPFQGCIDVLAHVRPARLGKISLPSFYAGAGIANKPLAVRTHSGDLPERICRQTIDESSGGPETRECTS